MEEDVAEVDSQEAILYDLTIHQEWQPEVYCDKEKLQISLVRRLAHSTARSFWTFLRTTGIQHRLAKPCTLPSNFVKFTNSHSGWKFCVSDDGEAVAVLTNGRLEIRSRQDDFTSVFSRHTVPRDDKYAQWSCLQWSPDGYMLALGLRTGQVLCIDLLGNSVCHINPEVAVDEEGPVDLSRSVAALVFIPLRTEDDSEYRLLIINHRGCLSCYTINVDQRSHTLSHTFFFTSIYPGGVSCALFSPTHSILYVGGAGYSDPSDQPNDTAHTSSHLTATSEGLSAWRLVDGPPHYKRAVGFQSDRNLESNADAGYVQQMKRLFKNPWSRNAKDQPVRLCLSPDASHLACVTLTSRLSLWSLPSLRPVSSWPLPSQPGSDRLSPDLDRMSRTRKERALRESPFYHQLNDVQWWSEECLALSRCSGAVTIVRKSDLANLLGESPEWCAPASQISATHHKAFLLLECESVRLKNGSPPTDSDRGDHEHQQSEEEDGDHEETEEEEEEEEEASPTLVSKFVGYTKHGLFNLTDMETFRPTFKKIRMHRKVYRLMSLKSITPEQLFERRLDNGEYGEALALSKVYGMDSDKVYQRQWQMSKVSKATINDYLRKISKLSWVLHECMERVPEGLDATRDLVNFGIRATSLQAVLEAGGHTGESYDSEEAEDSNDQSETESEDETMPVRETREEKLLKHLDFNKLTAKQKEMCRARLRLLQCLDRLDTYEEMLGGVYEADNHYDPDFFRKFRYQNIVEAAANFAQEENVTGLTCTFTYLGQHTLPHRLVILSNFPETLCPADYKDLLPSISETTQQVAPWSQEVLREPDWCESVVCRNALDPAVPQLGEFLYRGNPTMEIFRGLGKEDPNAVSKWYQIRAIEIERRSRLVDYSLELLGLGQERGAKDLGGLYNDLLTMDMLVYEAHISDAFLFSNLLGMSEGEKLKLLMNQSSDETYVRNLYRWLIPFLQRCEDFKPGSRASLLSGYLRNQAEDLGLLLVSQLYQASQSGPSTSPQKPPRLEFFVTDEEMLSVALDCIYTCDRDDQLTYAIEIYECLPVDSSTRNVPQKLRLLHQQVDSLAIHLNVAKLLRKHGVNICINQVKKYEGDLGTARALLTRLTRVSSRRGSPSESDWKKLLADLLTVQETIYPKLDKSVCYEVFVESLLNSGSRENIALAGTVMETSNRPKSTRLERGSSSTQILLEKLSYDKSIELVLKSSRELFNGAGHFTDPCMDLAKAILYLVEEPSCPAVREELDLIGALRDLSLFGLNTLPIKVRLCSDKLSLIAEIVQGSETAYKSDAKLLKAAELLRVCGSSEVGREGAVLQVIVQRAIELKDYRTAYKHCSHLIHMGYERIWTECMLLGQRPEYHNTEAKVELFSFALLHCSSECMEPLLKELTTLEVQILREELSLQCSDESSNSLSHTKHLLHTTSQTTHNLFRAVGSYSSDLLAKANLPGGRSKDRGPLGDFGTHWFYDGLISDGCLQPAQERPDELLIHVQKLLRLARLETLSQTSSLSSASSSPRKRSSSSSASSVSPKGQQLPIVSQSDQVELALLECAKVSTKMDFALTLAFLLDFPQCSTASREFFTSLPKGEPCYEIATYYYALRLSPWVLQEPCDKESMCYLLNPVTLVSETAEAIKNGKLKGVPAIKDWCEELVLYSGLLEDLRQAHLLRGLDRGVDVERFTADPQYKRDTVIGLAMSVDETHYETALSLASKYDLPLWDVHMSHVEQLLVDTSLSTSRVVQRLKQLEEAGVGDELRAGGSDDGDGEVRSLIIRAGRDILPLLPGTDHARLLAYFSLLHGQSVTAVQVSGPVVAPGSHSSAGQHAKTLKRIAASHSKVNYIHLMSSAGDPLTILEPVLTDTNVHVFAKLASKIPKDGGSAFLTSSSIWTLWAAKFFWTKSEKPTASEQASPTAEASKWIHRYEECKEFVNKMEVRDFIQLTQGILYTQNSIDKIPPSSRSEIGKRILKHCRQAEKKASKESGGASDTLKVVERLVDHLTCMQQETLLGLHQSHTKALQTYYRSIYNSQGATKEIESALVEMILDAQPLELVQDLIEVLPVGRWNLRKTYQEAVSIICKRLRNQDNSTQEEEADESFKTTDSGDVAADGPISVMDSLRSVIGQVGEHQQEGGSLVGSEDVMTLLRPLIADGRISVKTRLGALRSLEESFELNEADAVLLTLYRTEAVVLTLWPDTSLSESRVATGEERSKLLSELLGVCTELDQYQSLTSLLNAWPQSEHTSGQWLSLCESILEILPLSEISNFLIKTCKDLSLKEQHWSSLCTQLLDKSVVTAAVIGLQTGLKSLVEASVVALKSYEQTISEEPYLCQLLIENRCVVNLVETHHYTVLEDYLIDSLNTQRQQSRSEGEKGASADVRTVISDLQSEGHEAVAARLLLRERNTHPSLSTLSGALAALKGWMKN